MYILVNVQAASLAWQVGRRAQAIANTVPQIYIGETFIGYYIYTYSYILIHNIFTYDIQLYLYSYLNFSHTLHIRISDKMNIDESEFTSLFTYVCMHVHVRILISMYYM
jgi:hypothetical protein